MFANCFFFLSFFALSGYLHQLPNRRNANGSTVSAAALAALPSKRVRSNLGKGWVEDIRPDGFMDVKLDWTLANNRHARLITLEQHLRFLVDQTPLPPVKGAPEVGAPSSTAASSGADALPEESHTIINNNNRGGDKNDAATAAAAAAANTMELDLS